MSEMKKELREILYYGWKRQQGKRRYLLILFSMLLGVLGTWIGILAGERMPYEIYQIFVLCVIILAVFYFGILGLVDQQDN